MGGVICAIGLYLQMCLAVEASVVHFPPISTSLQLVAFHGDQTNYSPSNHTGMRWSGHLGARFSEHPTNIFGFSPKTELTNDRKTSALLNGTAFPGVINDDFHAFVDAIKSPYGFTMLFYDVPTELCSTDDCGLRIIQNELHASPLLHKSYAYPPLAPRIYRNLNHSECDGTWGESCFNCATYISSLGVQLFEHTGFFQYFIPVMSRQPSTTCRCYVSEEWVHSQHCERDFLPDCAYDEPPQPPVQSLMSSEPEFPFRQGAGILSEL